VLRGAPVMLRGLVGWWKMFLWGMASRLAQLRVVWPSWGSSWKRSC